MSTGMLIAAVLGTEQIDSSGEQLSVKGADISDWESSGGMPVNWNHQNIDNGPLSIVGKVVYAKKIYDASDCENAIQKEQWKQIQLPFITGIVRLHDSAGHANAQAIAAIIRSNAQHGEPISVRWSVEGQTTHQDGNVLEESIIKKLAATIVPCNRGANSILLEDPSAPEGFDKIHTKEDVKDLLDLDDSKKHDGSFCRRLGASFEASTTSIVDDEILGKSLEAGNYNAAPSTLTQGAALQREHLGSAKDRALIVANKYLNEKSEFDKAEFISFAKHKLPEASEEFLQHFSDAVEQVHIKRKQLVKKEAGKQQAAATSAQYALQEHVMSTGRPYTLHPPEPSQERVFAPNEWSLRGESGNHCGTVYAAHPDVKQVGDHQNRWQIRSLEHIGKHKSEYEVPKQPSLDHSKLLAQYNETGPIKAWTYGNHVYAPTDRYIHDSETELGLHSNHHFLKSELTKKESKEPAFVSEGVTKPKPTKVKEVDEEDASPVKIRNGTIRGIPTQPVKMKGYKFDEEKGILHTPKGSFPLYNPDKGFQTVEHKAAKKPFYQGGTLHVAPGTDLKTIPHNEANPGFREIYNSQPIEDFHSTKVMPNWMRVHELTKAGKIPEEVIMHSAMFSMMSPNTPVRPHELMYAHMADTFEDLGIDARDPDFKKAAKHWLGKDKPHNYPKTAEEYFKNHPDIHLGADSVGNNRKKGDLKSFMLGNNKFKNVAQYSKLHQTLVDIVKRHGTDSRAASNELMALKTLQIQWKNKRQGIKNKAKVEGLSLGLKNHASDYVKQKEAEATDAGLMGEAARQARKHREPGSDDDTDMPWDPRMLPGHESDDVGPVHSSIYFSPQRSRPTGDSAMRKQWKDEAQQLGLKNDLADHMENTAQEKLGDYQGTVVPGLAPKTGRFTFTMLGGGNTFVPDTHIVRHLFGMDPGKDAHSLAYLKSVLWNSKNSHVLEGMDRWYAKNHPAAQLMQQHPKWGPAFKDDPEQANFPSFWRHWCSIAEDERKRGIENASANEFSTHEPFWTGIDKFVNPVKKSEEDLEPHMIAKMLAMHKQYEQDHGEIPAQMMFFHHIVPHLLEAQHHREKHDDLSDFVKTMKLHSLEIALRKNIEDIRESNKSDPRIPSVHALYMKQNGNEHRAGRFALANNEIHHLEDSYGILNRFLPEGPINLKTVSTIHALKMNPNLKIVTEEAPSDKPDNNGSFADSIGQTPAVPAPAMPPSVFHYQRAGMDRPHTLEVTGGKYLLDGSELSHPEVQTILGNVKTKVATLRHKKPQMDQVQKMEEVFSDLMKAEEPPHAQDLLAYTREAEAKGHIPKGTSDNLVRHIYEDPLTGLGNQKAWHEFKSKNKPGVYVAGDGNSLSAVNNAFGHSVGDDAIRTYGNVMRSSMDESGNAGKLFRSGIGDEISAWFPSHEHAANFARKVHEKLEAVPPIQGVHKLSIGMGLGVTPEHADKALYAAKEQKYLPGQEGVNPRDRKKAFKVGQEPNFAHSLVPGNEGPVPLHDQQAEALQATLKTPPPVAAPAA